VAIVAQPTDRQEVAVYIDLENLRYGLLNHFGQEPDFALLVAKAKKYGRPSVMRAYADFSEHPPALRQRLHVAGIEAINVNVKRIRRPGYGRAVERVKNAADMILALDASKEAVDADANGKVKVFLLVTGDADYIQLVTLLKHRFGQQVMICGVPGSIGMDLVAAADGADHIEIEKTEPVEPELVRKALVAMIRQGPAPLRYWSTTIIDQWSQDKKHDIPGTAKEKRDALHSLLRDGVLAKREIDLTGFGKPGGKANETYLVEEKADEFGLGENEKTPQ
jgi:hypothetical protein